AHEALDGEYRVFRVGDLLVLGGLPDQPLAFFGETDDRRGNPRAGGVDQHLRLIAFHDRDTAIGRAEVDANDFRHSLYLLIDALISSNRWRGPPSWRQPFYTLDANNVPTASRSSNGVSWYLAEIYIPRRRLRITPADMP